MSCSCDSKTTSTLCAIHGNITTAQQREAAHFEEALRKKDERRMRLQIERDALLVVIQILAEENGMLRRAYEKDSDI